MAEGRNIYLDSKPRYEILDGLRGVAALMVVCFHLFEVYSNGDSTQQIINHGYLAVDFFFVLSGYVVGYAYDDRWDRMTVGGFFKRRLTRLHPMLVLGTFIGLLLFYQQDSSFFPHIAEVPVWKAVLAALIGMTLFPVRGYGFLDVRGWGEMHPINGPAWTLFFEYIANFLYAVVIRRLPRWALLLCVLLFAGLTLDVALNLDLFHLLGERESNANTMIGGWNVYDPRECYIGFTRLLYPFFCGLLLSRINAKIRTKGGFWWCSLLIVAMLAVPYLPWGAKGTAACMDGWYNAFCILLLFPLIVSIGAGSRLEGKKGAKVCKFLGDISFPLYISHYPLMYCHMGWVGNHPDTPRSVHAFVFVTFLLLATLMAYACLKLYDEPVREWLKEHWLKRKQK